MELIFEPGQIPFSTEEISDVTFHSFPLNGEAEGVASAFSIPELKRFLALHLKSIWWMVPAYGETAGEIPAQTQLLLGRLPDRRYLLLMPLVDRDLRATLRGNPQTGKAELFFEGTLKEKPQTEGTLLAGAEGTEHRLFTTHLWRREVLEIMPEILAWHPDAVICGNDYAAITVEHYLLERGIKIPGDILMSGGDNIPASSDCVVPISTFDQRAEACAVCCVEILFDLLRKNTPLHSVELHAEPIWRESTEKH